MKVLKIFLYVLLALVVIFVILGLVGPKSYDLSRSRVIAAPASAVWAHTNSLQAVEAWSPWTKMDTTMKIEFTGDPGVVGSMQKWESKKMGKGEQTLTVVNPNQSVETHLKFYGPMGNSESDSYITLQDTAGNTKVVWGMRGTNNFMGRVFSALMNMEKQIGPVFDRGLASLDSMVMAAPKVMSADYHIVPGDYAGGKYIGVREKVKIADMEAFFGKSYQAAAEAAKKANAEIAGPATGVYYMWDMEGGNTDVAAAFPVKNEVKAPAGVTYFTVPASKSLVMDYMGGYSGLYGAHNAFDAYLKANNLEHVAPVLEEYITDPMSQPDSTKWHTRIIYLVK